MEARFWRAGFVLLTVFGTMVSPERAVSVDHDAALCPKSSAAESILRPPRNSCPISDSLAGAGAAVPDLVGVAEGDELALQKALSLVHRSRDGYVAMLFYASWCPFSRACRPSFNALSSLFPTISHFAFEESVVRPSILSSDVTGIKPSSVDLLSMDEIVTPLHHSTPKKEVDLENCPFSWAGSPEKFLQQDTFLALATAFVLFRFFYFLFPKILACVKRAWRRHMRYASMISLWDCSQAYLEQARLVFTKLNPCKRSNLQGGAMNATAWASKSLASVAIGEPSSRRAQSGRDRR